MWWARTSGAEAQPIKERRCVSARIHEGVLHLYGARFKEQKWWAEATEDGKQDCSQYESENTDSIATYVLLLDSTFRSCLLKQNKRTSSTWNLRVLFLATHLLHGFYSTELKRTHWEAWWRRWMSSESGLGMVYSLTSQPLPHRRVWLPLVVATPRSWRERDLA